jgi:hypothetical protein
VAAGISATPQPGEVIVNGAAITDAGGAFTVANLPAAVYVLCASVPLAPYLDPCVWGKPIHTTVSARATTEQNLILEKGVNLHVRVNDPDGLLPQVIDGPWTPRRLLVGIVYGTGAYEGVPNTAVDSGGHSYQLIVPTGMSFNLWLYSTDVALADAKGEPVMAPAAGVPFQTSAGQDQAFTFTVSRPPNSAIRVAR